jgi:hypothetical protein
LLIGLHALRFQNFERPSLRSGLLIRGNEARLFFAQFAFDPLPDLLQSIPNAGCVDLIHQFSPRSLV